VNIGEKLKRIFNSRPIVGYVSDFDKCMEEFDKTHKNSASQEKEIEKHEKIAALRDKS